MVNKVLRLQQQQLSRLHDRDLREIPNVASYDMLEIAADARNDMFFEAPRYLEKAHIVPGTGFFDRDADDDDHLKDGSRPLRRTKGRTLFEIFASAWFLIVVRLLIFIFSAATLAHARIQLHLTYPSDSARIFLITWTSLAMIYSLSYVPLLYSSPVIAPFSFRSAQYRGWVIYIDSLTLSLQVVSVALMWQDFMYFDQYVEHEIRILLALQMVALMLWAIAHGITIILSHRTTISARPLR